MHEREIECGGTMLHIYFHKCTEYSSDCFVVWWSGEHTVSSWIWVAIIQQLQQMLVCGVLNHWVIIEFIVYKKKLLKNVITISKSPKLCLQIATARSQKTLHDVIYDSNVVKDSNPCTIFLIFVWKMKIEINNRCKNSWKWIFFQLVMWLIVAALVPWAPFLL